jgi:charged multivesicular body protein 4
MSGWLSYFTGSRDTKQVARTAIVGIREQLAMLDKKEEYLEKKIEEELKKAKANAVSNKAGASPLHGCGRIADDELLLGNTVAAAALRRKRTYEQQRDQLAGTRLTLEAQANAIESANMNAETMNAMKRGATALKDIHKQLNVDKVRGLFPFASLAVADGLVLGGRDDGGDPGADGAYQGDCRRDL